MKYVVALVSFALLGCAAILAQTRSNKVSNETKNSDTQQTAGASTTAVASSEVNAAVEKGAKWLASVQGVDGGWGQDGGRIDTNNTSRNDVANTAVAALALLRAGDKYRPNVERAVDFILKKIEASPNDELSITDVNQTQIQGKLGPYIDTFLASMLLAKIDGTFAGTNKTRVRGGLEKCVAKIERNQLSDGSWNIAGGWAPVLGTSLASQSLYLASKNGVKVKQEVMDRADTYTLNSQKGQTSVTSGSGSGKTERAVRDLPINGRVATTDASLTAAAGVDLYQSAQALEQLSRTAESRKENAMKISFITGKLSDTKFVEGYGSIGGEEFFSYLNISDSLKRTGGKEWNDWNSKMTHKILKLQNSDGTWAGHHCITGRVAVTSAAILNLARDREN